MDQAYNKAYAGLDAETKQDWENILAGVNNYSSAYKLRPADAAHVTNDAKKYLLGTLDGDDYSQYRDFFHLTNASARIPDKNFFGRLHHSDANPSQSETGQIVRYVYAGYNQHKGKKATPKGTSSSVIDWDWSSVMNETGDMSTNYNSDATRIQAMNRRIQATLDRYNSDNSEENKAKWNFITPHGFDASTLAERMAALTNRKDAKKLWRDLGGDNEWIKQLFPEADPTTPSGPASPGNVKPGKITTPNLWGSGNLGNSWVFRDGAWWTTDQTQIGKGDINYDYRDPQFNNYYYVDPSGKLHYGTNAQEDQVKYGLDNNLKNFLTTRTQAIQQQQSDLVPYYDVNLFLDNISDAQAAGFYRSKIAPSDMRFYDFSRQFGSTKPIWMLGGKRSQNFYGTYELENNSPLYYKDTKGNSVAFNLGNTPFNYIIQGDNELGTEDFPNEVKYETLFTGEANPELVKAWDRMFTVNNAGDFNRFMDSLKRIAGSDLYNAKNGEQQAHALGAWLNQKYRNGDIKFTEGQILELRNIIRTAHNSIYNKKEGGVITAKKGTKIPLSEQSNGKWDKTRIGYFGAGEASSITEEAAANRMPGIDGWSAQDWQRLGSAIADLSSIVAAWIPGYGTAASAVLGVGSSVNNLVADITEDGFQWRDIGNLGVNLAFDVVGLFGGVGKVGKVVKTLSKFATPIMAGFEFIGNSENYKQAFTKLVNGEGKDMTANDWRTLIQGLSMIAGLNRQAASGYKTKKAQNNALLAQSDKKFFKIKAKQANTTTGKLTDVEVPLTAEELKKLQTAPDLQEANKLLRNIGGNQDLELVPDKKMQWKFWRGKVTQFNNPLAEQNFKPERIAFDYGVPGNEKLEKGLTTGAWGRATTSIGKGLGLASDVDIATGRNRALFFAPKQVKAPVSTSTPTSTPATKKGWYFGKENPNDFLDAMSPKEHNAFMQRYQQHLNTTGVNAFNAGTPIGAEFAPTSMSRTPILMGIEQTPAFIVYKQGGKFYTPLNKE